MRLMVTIAALLLTVAGCAGPRLVDYADQQPKLVLEEYFDGELEAWGVFQDRFDDVRSSFKVDIEGDWDGETLTLIENFAYDDGTTELRVWRLKKTGGGTWTGETDGVVGVATGVVSGNAFNFVYEFELERPSGNTLTVSFDDWMWLQDKQVLINRAYVSKFGVEIGTVSIFFRRKTE